MGKALYRTHRSKKLSEVVGQDHITATLSNALKSGKISHAYLFTGPRGVGKTSVARILAHEINKLPYTDESQHIDIIEIDAASNRRIDEIRDLRDKARLSPLQAPYKVYIIDEVHMLTREAFNALLKTLEEPPEHVIFILATTEAHKLPETIISRTQRYSFKPIETKAAAQHLQDIAKQEKIKLEPAAAELIARHGNGSFRDSISLLDQMSNTGQAISVEGVRQHLGIPPDEVIEALVSAFREHDAKKLLAQLNEAQTSGYQAPVIANYLSERLRSVLLDGSLPTDQTLKVLRGLLDVAGADNPYQELELVLLETALEDRPIAKSVDQPAAPEPELEPEQPVKEAKKTTKKSSSSLAVALDEGLWDEVLEKLRGAHNTLYGVARMAKVSADDQTLVLGFAFDFHRRRLDEARNRDKLQAVIAELFDQPVEIRCESDKSGPKTAPNAQEQPAKSDTLESITKVFGGGEVLED